MGFGASSRVHTVKVLRLSEDLPIVIEIVDRREKIDELLPHLEEMVTEGGWLSDDPRRRRPVAVAGYLVTGLSTGAFALATAWPPVLVSRDAGWIARGMRGPARDAMLADAVPPEARGRAFGFHRAMDSAGAVVGPALAAAFATALARKQRERAGSAPALRGPAPAFGAAAALCLIMICGPRIRRAPRPPARRRAAGPCPSARRREPVGLQACRREYR
jgi:MFS family permease